MRKVLTLLEAIRDLDSFDEGNTVYAAEPWAADSEAIVAREPANGGLPAEAAKLGLKYFLEVFIAREFLEDWRKGLGTEPTTQEQIARLIQFAVTDA